MSSALGHDFVEFLAVFGRHNIRPPHFARKVSYSASPQTFTECSRSTSCCYAALLFGPKPRRDFLDFENPKVMRRPAVPILFSERGTRHDRTRDETRSNAGRDAIERGRAFAIKYRDRIGLLSFSSPRKTKKEKKQLGAQDMHHCFFSFLCNFSFSHDGEYHSPSSSESSVSVFLPFICSSSSGVYSSS